MVRLNAEKKWSLKFSLLCGMKRSNFLFSLLRRREVQQFWASSFNFFMYSFYILAYYIHFVCSFIFGRDSISVFELGAFILLIFWQEKILQILQKTVGSFMEFYLIKQNNVDSCMFIDWPEKYTRSENLWDIWKIS